MKTISVKSRSGGYNILVGQGLLKKTGGILRNVLPAAGKVMIVSQKNLRTYSSAAARSLGGSGFRVFRHDLPDGESAKSSKELFRLLSALLKSGFERPDAIVAVGGGVVSDLAGFAASVYLRGIAYVNIGTTLLAQVDSSIGGKTAINLPEGKNLMGAFYPPRLVLSDTGVLNSLPARELSSSLAEVVKYAVIRDASLFAFLERHTEKILRKDRRALEKIISVSARIKAGVVSRDEFETKGERMILNYGHTFAHGIEKAAGYGKISHGEAVSLGMVMAAELAVRLKLCLPALKNRQDALLKALGLPVSIRSAGLRPVAIVKAMMQDKKKKGGQLRFVLPRRAGLVTIHAGISSRLVAESISTVVN